MIQKNLFGMLKMAEIQKNAYEAGRPIQATFELTPRCGFDCRMCYVHLPVHRISEVGDGRELTGEEWLEIGRQIAEMGVLSLCITGGDPICHPDFKMIWKGLAQLGFQLTLQTNASQLSEEILELLDEYPPELVKITLYGSNDAVYKEVCRIDQGFTRTDAGIQALKERNHNIQLVTTFIKQNKEDVEHIRQYAKDNQLPWYYSASCYPSLRGAESEARECALKECDLEEIEKIPKFEKQFIEMKDEKLPAEYCSGYRTAFDISWDGMMRFCLFLNKPDISTIKLGVEESWNQLLEYWKNVQWPKECYSCKDRVQCKRCIAHVACLNGGFNKVSPKYCKWMKEI